MIFPPELVAKILTRSKTMTREPLRAYKAPRSPWITHRDGTRSRRPVPRTKEVDGQRYLYPYRPGKAIPVQKSAGTQGVAHIEVTDVSIERAGEITKRDAEREGFRSVTAFKAHWCATHDKAWIARQPVATYPTLAARFDAEHADTLVWILEFRLVEAPPLYLARAAGYTSTQGQSLDADDDVDAAIADDHPSRGDDGYSEPVPTNAPRRKPKPLLSEVHAAIETTLVRNYTGWEPEDIHADNPRLGTPGDIRAMRRSMGLRGTDGLDPIPPNEVERVLDFMLLREASTREIALAMDCSQTQARRLIAARRDEERAA